MAIKASSSKSDVYRAYIAAINEHRYEDIGPYVDSTAGRDGETSARTVDEHVRRMLEEWAGLDDLTIAVDVLIEDDTEAADKRPLAARLLGRGLSGGKPVAVDSYSFVDFNRDAGTGAWVISSAVTMTNPWALAEQLSDPDARNYSSDGVFSDTPVKHPDPDFDLDQRAHAWIDWIMKENVPSGGARAAEFIHDPVMKAGKQAPAEDLARQLAQHITAFGNVTYDIYSLIINRERQQVAFYGMMYGSKLDGAAFYGAPSIDSPVEMPTVLFYQFRDGKVAADWVISDFNGLIKQVEAAAAAAAATTSVS